MVVEEYGGARTDVGNLGSGIYFSDCINTSLKYGSKGDKLGGGRRLVAVNEVALGGVWAMWKVDTTLTSPPDGHDSVHGRRNTADTPSDFEVFCCDKGVSLEMGVNCFK